MVLNLAGVELTQALSDFCTFLFTIPFFIKFVKELNEKTEKQNTVENKQELGLE